jgi:ethanolamine ammonia-lyase small subunit
VHHEFNLHLSLGRDFCERWKLFEVTTLAQSKPEYLLRPDHGRQLSADAKRSIADQCPSDADVQVVIGDGLSVSAVAVQVPQLLPLLIEGAQNRGWKTGRSFAVRYCRVGVLNEIGDLLHPRVAILLIGERPGLATAESLSAYLAYQPRSGHTDADRNLVSNIHARGTPPIRAVGKILHMAASMMVQKRSGTALATADAAILP